METKYDAKLYEEKIGALWNEVGLSQPNKKGQKAFTIILPPPNANDPLHIGHAMYVVEDILVRYQRMLGKDVLWLPGADHAGIETQFVFEKKLAKQGKSRFQYDRESLYQLIWDYVQENKNVAREQLEKLGFSLDWSRYKFTLDEDVVKTVKKTFTDLYNKDLVYREQKLVNYCPKCGTAFSDLEIKHVERKTPLYYLKYGPFVVATTRPETIFGDTGVAVHPKDERYQKYIGQELKIMGPNGEFEVKVVADEYVDPEFGTGVVKITPAHDHNDYEVWQRHKNELMGPKQIIGFDGRLSEKTGEFAGLKVAVARGKVVEKLEQMGLVEKIDQEYVTQISSCYRCGGTLEPLPLAQFFVKTAPLTKPIIEKLDAGEIKVYGPGYDKILRHWLINLRDWNISRQIVWGIRIPVWYRVSENPGLQLKIIINLADLTGEKATKLREQAINSQEQSGAKESSTPLPYQIKLINQEQSAVISGSVQDLSKDFNLEEIKKGLQTLEAPLDATMVVADEMPGEDYLQETDTFDTWFSSSQWPFATLMNTQVGDFERFYPTTVMETGYDILPFWVMRMLFMGYFATGELPFTNIYLHGLVRDAKGQKMSKSKGNVINPLEVVEKYGADALRFALIVRSSAGLDKSVSEADFKAARNLTNKIWNAARFVSGLEEGGAGVKENEEKLAQELKEVTAVVSKALDDYRPGLAADSLYDSFWHYFCDKAIEEGKKGLLSPTLLKEALKTYLKLWAPFLPFVSEAIWQELKLGEKMIDKVESEDEKILGLSSWPRN